MQKNLIQVVMLLLAMTACMVFLFPYKLFSSQDKPSAEPITLLEAEILIYLLPYAQDLRAQGMDIGWELQTSPEINDKDSYIFWVVNTKRPNVQGSRTVGYFAVNKHTADVWDEGMERFVVSRELAGVQDILRKGHHIDSKTIEKYRRVGQAGGPAEK